MKLVYSLLFICKLLDNPMLLRYLSQSFFLNFNRTVTNQNYYANEKMRLLIFAQDVSYCIIFYSLTLTIIPLSLQLPFFYVYNHLSNNLSPISLMAPKIMDSTPISVIFFSPLLMGTELDL